MTMLSLVHSKRLPNGGLFMELSTHKLNNEDIKKAIHLVVSALLLYFPNPF